MRYPYKGSQMGDFWSDLKDNLNTGFNNGVKQAEDQLKKELLTAAGMTVANDPNVQAALQQSAQETFIQKTGKFFLEYKWPILGGTAIVALLAYRGLKK